MTMKGQSLGCQNSYAQYQYDQPPRGVLPESYQFCFVAKSSVAPDHAQHKQDDVGINTLNIYIKVLVKPIEFNGY